MNAIDRRNALRILAAGAVAAGCAISPLHEVAEATPLAMLKDPERSTGNFRQKAQADTTGRPGPPPHRPPAHRPPHRHRHRRRRWVCWWERGRRRCGWRWV